MMLAVPDMSRGQGTSARITEAISTIVADQGIDCATVREVARVAGVSIGTVQHHFPTKDAMLLGAFTDVVRRIRTRLEGIELGDDVRRNVLVVLEEILPLDERRSNEARIQLGFAVRAIHEPSLAATQRVVLGELHDALSHALAAAGSTTPHQAGLAAHAALALADGLALHALSTRNWLTPHESRAALEVLVRALVPVPPPTNQMSLPSSA